MMRISLSRRSKEVSVLHILHKKRLKTGYLTSHHRPPAVTLSCSTTRSTQLRIQLAKKEDDDASIFRSPRRLQSSQPDPHRTPPPSLPKPNPDPRPTKSIQIVIRTWKPEIKQCACAEHSRALRLFAPRRDLVCKSC
jgi:hypothetical protein